MSLGSLVTMGRYGPPNLLVLLFENRSYEMTGGQPLAPKADFVTLALGAGLEKVERIDDLSAFDESCPASSQNPVPISLSYRLPTPSRFPQSPTPTTPKGWSACAGG